MTVSFFVGILSFILYYFYAYSPNIKRETMALFRKDIASFWWIQSTRAVAFIAMCILPFTFEYFKGNTWDIKLIWTSLDTTATLILATLLIPLGAVNAKNIMHLKQYPQVRMRHWNALHYIINILSWGIYLLAYEYLFRGVLFLGILAYTKLHVAILLNTILYALAHLHKGKKEVLGAIPLGVVFCLLSYYSGSFWAAFVIHWIMAANNFIWSHYYSKN
jgi:membrane protease YdiL (CAAX protease family)